MADADGELMTTYGVKLPLIKVSKRVTFVIGKDRKILHVDEGSAAVSTDGAIAACSLF